MSVRSILFFLLLGFPSRQGRYLSSPDRIHFGRRSLQILTRGRPLGPHFAVSERDLVLTVAKRSQSLPRCGNFLFEGWDRGTVLLSLSRSGCLAAATRRSTSESM